MNNQNDVQNDRADKKSGNHPKGKSANKKESFIGELTSRLNYLCVEHWLTSAIFILAIGFIAFSIQSYFSSVTPARWGAYGSIIVLAYMGIAISHFIAKQARSMGASAKMSASAVNQCVSEYVTLLDWLEAGSRKSAMSIRFAVTRCPELFLHAKMKPGAYVEKVTEIQEGARRHGMRPDWTKIKAQVHADPELILVLQEMQEFDAQAPDVLKKIDVAGKSLAAMVASSEWDGDGGIEPFLELESSITSGKTGDELWAAIDSARKQGKRFQYSVPKG